MDHRIVNQSTSYFKTISKDRLKGQWVKAVIAAGIYTAIVGIVDFIIELFMQDMNTGLLSVGYFIIVYGAATVGLYSYFVKVIRSEENGLGSSFEGFASFGRSFVLGFLMLLFIVLWGLLLIIPGIIASFRYALAPMILRDRPDLTPLQCIKESKRLMKGNKANLLTLDLSFIGWYLLMYLPELAITLFAGPSLYNSPIVSIISLLTIILSLWVMAYMTSSVVVFYEEAILPVPTSFNSNEQNGEEILSQTDVPKIEEKGAGSDEQ